VWGGHKGNTKSSEAQPPSPHLVPRRVVLCANHHTKSSSSLGIRHRPPRVGRLARVTQSIVGHLESLAVLGCRCNSSHALKRSDCQGVPAACLRVQVLTSAATSTARTTGVRFSSNATNTAPSPAAADVAAKVRSRSRKFGHSSSNITNTFGSIIASIGNHTRLEQTKTTLTCPRPCAHVQGVQPRGGTTGRHGGTL
jgi:hypothetical protein